MPPKKIREKSVEKKIEEDYFGDFDCTNVLGDVDVCVAAKSTPDIRSLLWAEAKPGKSDIHKSIVQLILTIGKARTFDKHLPPAFLGGMRVYYYDCYTLSPILHTNIY